MPWMPNYCGIEIKEDFFAPLHPTYALSVAPVQHRQGNRIAGWGSAVVVVVACGAGCGGSSPPPAAPQAVAVPPDSPLAKIHVDMVMPEVAAVLGAPYTTEQYTTGKQFIPFYNWWGGDQFRTSWHYRGIGRVVFTRHNGYGDALYVLQVEYDPSEGGGAPPPPPPPPEGAAAPPPPPADSYADNDPSALTDFRTALNPYGAWVDDPTYGTVWVPSAGVIGVGFAPYSTSGHWVHDDDWVWVSDYDWGWAPFHYGRWVPIEGRGWAWIPGREYRGAWVSWQVDDGYAYMGWSPAPPEFIWGVGGPVVFQATYSPRYVYVPRAEVFSPMVGQRVLSPQASVSVQVRMHSYAAEPGGHAGGPPPEKLGYTAARVPHSSAADQAKLAPAKGFSRPSSAVALGARPPTKTATGMETAASTKGPATAPQKTAAPATQKIAASPPRSAPAPAPKKR
jgi:hypothetical protein